jgi:hypothetical protein
MATTGDLAGKVDTLQRLLRHIKYPGAVDEAGCVCVCGAGERLALSTRFRDRKNGAAAAQQQRARSRGRTKQPQPPPTKNTPPRLQRGDPAALLPLLHHALLRYSRHVARRLVESGLEVKMNKQHTHKHQAPPTTTTTTTHNQKHTTQQRTNTTTQHQLHGKTDARFVEGAFRAAREVLGVRTALRHQQFLEQVRGGVCACARVRACVRWRQRVRVRFFPCGTRTKPRSHTHTLSHT